MSVISRRPLALAAAVATAAALGATALATAPSASAAAVPLSGYELTWGIKQSYRTYVATYAAGTFTPAGGASQAENNGAFTFVEGAGSYDSTAHTLSLGFRGSLNIVSTAHGFDITLSDLKFDSALGEITADVTKDGTTKDDVPLAKVTVTRDMKDMATTLTPEAGDALGSASYANAAGDPLTVVQTTPSEPSSPEPTGTTSPEPTDSSTPEPTDSSTATPTERPSETAEPTASPSDSSSASASPSPSETHAATKGDIVDGTLGWGVKESFRSYVVSGVAQGKITVSGGATQAAGNGAFTFVDATGSYDTDADTLAASFKGAVTFKGHESNGTYALDLSLSDLKASFHGATGELTADVTSLGEKSQDVVLADLKSGTSDLTAANDVITLKDVKATLTAAGAEAFSGFYQEGTELDTVNLSVALTEGAELPSGNGGSGTAGGSGGTSGGGSGDGYGTSGSTSGGITGGVTGGVGGSLASTGAGIPAGALGAAAAATVAAGAAAVFAMRRRRTEA
ncbi:HtaA domain-containing protein [Streptomyces nodosus]